MSTLERPLFTCGMVLTDTDLTALTDWVRARLALQRHRTGWGIACGLDVTCLAGRPSWVTVQPGYAVAPDGADLVVGAPIEIDLSPWCTSDCGSPAPEPQPCGDIVLDLLLTAAETPALTEPVGQCGCDGGCSPGGVVATRICEGAGLLVKPVPLALANADPGAAGAAEWRISWLASRSIVDGYRRQGLGSGSADEIIGWLKKQPIDPPCSWWPQLLADLTATEANLQQVAASALLDLVVAARHRLLSKPCPPDDDGVPLARVWLRRDDCAVMRIDAYPPYRRLLARSAPRPLEPGDYDLTPFFWQRWEQAAGQWHAIAGNAEARHGPWPSDVDELAELMTLTEEPSAAWTGPAPMPVLISTPCLGGRIIGFLPPDLDPTHGKVQQAVPTEAPEPAEPAASEPAASEPMAEAAGRAELEEVDGIGRQSARTLRRAGIRTVSQLAGAPVAVVTTLLPGRRVDRIQADARRRAAS